MSLMGRPVGSHSPRPQQDQEWKLRGRCRGRDNPDLFYGETSRDSIKAKRMCEPCPVIQECLEHALAARERFGVWGGCTRDERVEIARNRRRAAARAAS